MSDVKQTIQVTNAGLSPILSIAQGTGMVDFEFTVSDFLIPAGSTAVAWNIQPTGNIVSQVCTLVGNVITVTPPAYYFLRGKNYMQIQVTGADGGNLFTFLIEVWCYPNISAPVVSQNPDLISQLIQLVGNTEDLETTSKSNLVAAINEIYNRGDVDVLDTEEEIEANTATGKATGALVTKQLISDFGGCTFSVQSDGAYVTYIPSGGADPVSKKLGSGEVTVTVSSQSAVAGNSWCVGELIILVGERTLITQDTDVVFTGSGDPGYTVQIYGINASGESTIASGASGLGNGGTANISQYEKVRIYVRTRYATSVSCQFTLS